MKLMRSAWIMFFQVGSAFALYHATSSALFGITLFCALEALSTAIQRPRRDGDDE